MKIGFRIALSRLSIMNGSSTIAQASAGASNGALFAGRSDAGLPIDLDYVDTLEPLAFEDWVLGQLRGAGLEVNRTPRQDGGADGVCYGERFGRRFTVLLQCKHTQSETNCGPAAVEEVVASLSRYRKEIRGDVSLLVVTNAKSFSVTAHEQAAANHVRLVARAELSSLREYRPS